MRSKINIPLIFSLLIITIYPFIAYIIFVPFLGFYNDDWLFGYLGHFYGPQALIKGFAGDRPFVGYLFALNHILLGSNLFFWHIYMFLMRLLGGYILFFLLKKIWPDRLVSITYITLLFLIYPGFLQQGVPLGYQNYITALTVWIASLFFTVWAFKSRNKVKHIIFTLTALILQIFSFLLLEFFIGMEILRLLLIIYGSSPTFSSWINFVNFKKKLKYLIPYIVCLLIFVLWRVFIFKSIRSATNIDWITKNYYSDPVWIARIPLKVIYSFFSAVILTYFTPMIVRFTKIPLENSIISLSIGTISSAPLYIYYKIMNRFKYDKSLNDSSSNKDWGKNLLLIGVISIFAALIPIIISGRYVSVSYDLSAFDRYTISSIIGVGFILTGLLVYKTSSAIHNWVIILFVVISITTHLMNGYWHTMLWDKQKDVWWQLYWRTPQIQKNALLIFDSPEVADTILPKDVSISQSKNLRSDDYLIWAPGNLFFNYSNPSTNHFSGQYLSNSDTVYKIKNKVIESIAQESSTINYTKDFNNSIIVSLPTKQSCLMVLDNQRKELHNNSSELAKTNISYSNIDKLVEINTTSFIPPPFIFGVEPSKNWCYYFQKASLARQRKKWDQLNQLAQEVLVRNLKPKDPNEWLPFIEGLIVSKKYSDAENLIKIASENKSAIFTDNLCRLVSRIGTGEFKKYCN